MDLHFSNPDYNNKHYKQMSKQNKTIKASITFLVILTIGLVFSCSHKKEATKIYAANDPHIQYVGRIDNSNPELPRFWAPGVYAQFIYEGDSCIVTINDELPWKNSHNYISINIDNKVNDRIKLTDKVNKINIGEKVAPGKHKVTICKTTESGIGYVEMVNIQSNKLLEPDCLPDRKIEFYGNSITCGTGADTSALPCDSGEWHDKHNAYMAYGPVTARALNAQWVLTSVSGIGMVHSCCNLEILMPQVYNKVNLRSNEIEWDFSKYQPDVVTICLGQNDGVQDSTLFCSAYVNFIQTLRNHYPTSKIICLNSPMGDGTLNPVLKNYISSIVNHMNSNGDKYVSSFFFSRSYVGGCDYHPTIEEHQLIAEELTGYIKDLMKWE